MTDTPTISTPVTVINSRPPREDDAVAFLKHGALTSRYTILGVALSTTAHVGLMSFALSQMGFSTFQAVLIAFVTGASLATFDLSSIHANGIEKGLKKLQIEDATSEIPAGSRFLGFAKILARLGFSVTLNWILALFVVIQLFQADIAEYTEAQQNVLDQAIYAAAATDAEKSQAELEGILERAKGKVVALQVATDDMNASMAAKAGRIEAQIDSTRSLLAEKRQTERDLQKDVARYELNSRCEEQNVQFEGCQKPSGRPGTGRVYDEWLIKAGNAEAQRRNVVAEISELEKLLPALLDDLAREEADMQVLVPEELTLALVDLENANAKLHEFKTNKADWIDRRIQADPTRIEKNADSTLQSLNALWTLGQENAEFATLILAVKCALIMLETLGLMIGLSAPVGEREMKWAAGRYREIRRQRILFNKLQAEDLKQAKSRNIQDLLNYTMRTAMSNESAPKSKMENV